MKENDGVYGTWCRWSGVKLQVVIDEAKLSLLPGYKEDKLFSPRESE